METKHQTISEIEAEWVLVQRAQKDPALFAPLYSRHFKAIYLFIVHRVPEDVQAEDLTAIVFTKALHNLAKYTHRGLPFSAWLYRIAYNEIQGYYRSTKRERVIQFSEESLNILSNDLHSSDGHQEVQEENEQLLLEGLEQLSEEEMLWIELRFFENRSFKEIADIQQVTENNAKVKTYRIVEKLRKIIVTRKD